jgi:hypothetical protein
VAVPLQKAHGSYRITNDSFASEADPGERARYLWAAKSAVQAVDDLFGTEPPLGRRPFYFEFHGAAPCADPNDPTRYRAYLWRDSGPVPDGEVIYQGAHELGHFFLGPCRSNFAVEVLACAVSHEIVSALAPEYGRFKIEWFTSEAPPHVRAMSAYERRLFFASLRMADRVLRGRLGYSVNEDRGLQCIAAEMLRQERPVWSSLAGLAHRCSSPITDWPHPKWQNEWNELDLVDPRADTHRALNAFGWI